MNESKLRDKIKKYLQKKNCFFRKTAGSVYVRNLVDFLICINGIFIGIEIKTEWGKLTKLQEIEIKQIQEKGGGISYVTYGYDDFVKKFDYIYEEILKWKMEKVKKLQSEVLER